MKIAVEVSRVNCDGIRAALHVKVMAELLCDVRTRVVGL